MARYTSATREAQEKIAGAAERAPAPRAWDRAGGASVGRAAPTVDRGRPASSRDPRWNPAPGLDPGLGAEGTTAPGLLGVRGRWGRGVEVGVRDDRPPPRPPEPAPPLKAGTARRGLEPLAAPSSP